MNTNQVSAVLTPANKTAATTAIETLRTNLPVLIDLTPEERHDLLKLGEKSEAFVRKAMDLASKDNSFLPRSFDVAEMQKDVDLYFDLQSLFRELSRLTEGIDDTLIVAGSEAYAAALAVYRSAKDNGKGDLLDGWIDELGKKFVRKSKSGQPTPTATV